MKIVHVRWFLGGFLGVVGCLGFAKTPLDHLFVYKRGLVSGSIDAHSALDIWRILWTTLTVDYGFSLGSFTVEVVIVQGFLVGIVRFGWVI